MTHIDSHPQSLGTPAGRKGFRTVERVARAAAICKARGVAFTTNRREVLELLIESQRPIGAYELIDAMAARTSLQIAPTTVYRALDFLIAQGIAAKIESLNAYVPVSNPERRNDLVFFICSHCGSSQEIVDTRVERSVFENAALIGFLPLRRVLEVSGVCKHCVKSDAVERCQR